MIGFIDMGTYGLCYMPRLLQQGVCYIDVTVREFGIHHPAKSEGNRQLGLDGRYTGLQCLDSQPLALPDGVVVSFQAGLPFFKAAFYHWW